MIVISGGDGDDGRREGESASPSRSTEVEAAGGGFADEGAATVVTAVVVRVMVVLRVESGAGELLGEALGATAAALELAAGACSAAELLGDELGATAAALELTLGTGAASGSVDGAGTVVRDGRA